MDGAESSLKPLPARPRALRQRSQSAVTKPSPDSAIDSDASKRSSVGVHRHRHTQSHHHIPHHPKRFVKDRLGLQNGSATASTPAELSKQTSRISDAPGAAEGWKGSQTPTPAPFGLDGAVASQLVAGVGGEEVERLVLEEQWKNQKRQQELQSTLHSLSEQSMKTTRRLDDLYYALLEKLSGLRGTIGNLQELAGLTKRLHEQFREDTGELTGDLRKQIEAFGGFKAQQVKIEAIDGRMKESREKADRLSERLERARERVSALEVREKEWQDSVSWRLRWMWIILGTIAGIIVAFWMMHMFYPTSTNARGSDLPVMNLSLTSLTSVPTSVKSVMEQVMETSIHTTAYARSTPSGASSMSSRISKLMEPTTPADSDPLLIVFDEL